MSLLNLFSQFSLPQVVNKMSQNDEIHYSSNEVLIKEKFAINYEEIRSKIKKKICEKFFKKY